MMPTQMLKDARAKIIADLKAKASEKPRIVDKLKEVAKPKAKKKSSSAKNK